MLDLSPEFLTPIIWNQSEYLLDYELIKYSEFFPIKVQK
jgi:hypothetical protein